jgi:hypothetical protein
VGCSEGELAAFHNKPEARGNERAALNYSRNEADCTPHPGPIPTRWSEPEPGFRLDFFGLGLGLGPGFCLSPIPMPSGIRPMRGRRRMVWSWISGYMPGRGASGAGAGAGLSSLVTLHLAIFLSCCRFPAVACCRSHWCVVPISCDAVSWRNETRHTTASSKLRQVLRSWCWLLAHHRRSLCFL